VERQIEYGAQRGVPWGMSESGYNLVDAHLNYQYRAFGVPGLGLKRGLAEDLVVAPYASVLALMVAPEEACDNLRRLLAEGCEGRYGFYEAIDYTPSRLPRGQDSALVQSFMAHHQGMSFPVAGLSAAGPADAKVLRGRPGVQATLLLLQERIPKAVAPYLHTSELAQSRTPERRRDAGARVRHAPHPHARSAALVEWPLPRDGHQRGRRLQPLEGSRRHALARRQHARPLGHVLLRARRRQRDVLVDRLPTSAQAIRQLRSDLLRIPGRVPLSQARSRHHTEIAVSPEDDIELRRITITNRARKRRTIDLTSYAEVVLASPAADAQHPGFSNLFVQSEILRQRQAILCTRRPRSAGEASPWMFHLMAVHGAEAGEISYETDRSRFIGRGRTVADPEAMSSGAKLSDSEGSVLDPIVAIRQRITLEPNASATANIVTGVGETREACLELVDKYQDRRLADRVFDLAWTHSQVALQQINASEADAQLYAGWPEASCTPTPRCAPTRMWSRTTVAASPACGAIRFPATCPSCC
jgi:cyclic beta-1,2-glucan synthetase